MRSDRLPNTYDEALTRIIQEAAEVIQAVTKLQQYGFVATDNKTGITYDNVVAMLSEFNDLEHAINTIRVHHKTHWGDSVNMPNIPIPIFKISGRRSTS